TGAAISPPSPDGRPGPPGRSSPLSAGDGNMLLRLRDLGICEAQIMSLLPIFAMASSENGQIGCVSTLSGGGHSGGRRAGRAAVRRMYGGCIGPVRGLYGPVQAARGACTVALAADASGGSAGP